MIITNSTLPPRYGFIEIIDENGEHIYQPTPERVEKENQQKQIVELTEENASLKELIDSQESVLSSILEEIIPSLIM